MTRFMCASLLGLVVLLALGAGLAAAAGQQPPAPPPAPSERAPAFTADQKREAELLALKAQLTAAYREISALKAAIGSCEAQLGPLQFEQNRQTLLKEQAALVAAYEKANPGWTLDAAGTPVKKPK